VNPFAAETLPVIVNEPLTRTEPVNECISLLASPNVLEPLLNTTLAVWLTVVKFTTVKFVIVVPLNCAEELIIPVPPNTCDEPLTTPVGNNGTICADDETIPADIPLSCVNVTCDEPENNVFVADALPSYVVANDEVNEFKFNIELLTDAEYVFKFVTEILTLAEVVSKFVNLAFCPLSIVVCDEVNAFMLPIELLTDAEYVFKLLTEMFTDAEVVSKFVNLIVADEVNEFNEPNAAVEDVNKFNCWIELLTLAE
jgi:hypothetical protein